MTGKDSLRHALAPRRRLWSQFRRFRQLSWKEQWYLFEALAAVPLASLALRVVGFRRLRRALAGLGPEDSAASELGPSALESARVAARMVAAASREGLHRGSCLEQSLALCWLLRQRKIPAQLRLGVRKQANGIEAHAWVELFGVVLNDSGDVDRCYAALAGDFACSLIERR